MIIKVNNVKNNDFVEKNLIPSYSDIAKNPDLIMFLEDPDDEIAQLAAISNDPEGLFFIKNPTSNVRMKAIKAKGEVIGYFNDASKEECLAAVKQNGNALFEISYYRNGEYIDSDIIKQAIISNPDILIDIPDEKITEEMIIAAINKDINSIYYINLERQITENVILEVVKKNGVFIRLFDNPSEEVKRVAILQNKFAKLYIKD